MKRFFPLISLSLLFIQVKAQSEKAQNLGPQTELQVEKRKSTTDSLVVLETEIKKNEQEIKVKLIASLFPNPCQNELNIHLNFKIREARISIFNQNGQHCKTFMVNQVDKFSFDHKLKPGFYIFSIVTEQNSEQFHFKVK